MRLSQKIRDQAPLPCPEVPFSGLLYECSVKANAYGEEHAYPLQEAAINDLPSLTEGATVELAEGAKISDCVLTPKAKVHIGRNSRLIASSVAYPIELFIGDNTDVVCCRFGKSPSYSTIHGTVVIGDRCSLYRTYVGDAGCPSAPEHTLIIGDDSFVDLLSVDMLLGRIEFGPHAMLDASSIGIQRYADSDGVKIRFGANAKLADATIRVDQRLSVGDNALLSSAHVHVQADVTVGRDFAVVYDDVDLKGRRAIIGDRVTFASPPGERNLFVGFSKFSSLRIGDDVACASFNEIGVETVTRRKIC